MAERVGIGLAHHPFHDLKTISLRYFPREELALGAFFGLDSLSGNSATLLGVRAQSLLISEEQLLFFAAGSAMLLSEKAAGTPSSSGIEIDATIGADFFLSGLPRLGFTFEAGVALRSLGGTRFQTVGGALATGAIHYYF